jgi:hypothetical protein
MKNLFNIISAIILAQSAFSQCSENSAFDITGSPLTMAQASNAFDNNLVTDWYDGIGTPSIFGDPGNTYAWMWSENRSGTLNLEEVLTDYDFEAGKTYQISFDIRTDDHDGNPNAFNQTIAASASANIYAIDKDIVIPRTSNTIPGPNSSFAQQVWTHSNSNNSSTWFSDFAGAGWTHISLSFTPSSDWGAIMIFPYMNIEVNPVAVYAVMMVDNFEIVGPIENNFHFQSTDSWTATPETSFPEGCDVYLNGVSSKFENRYFIGGWKRQLPAGNWVWMPPYIGWTPGEIEVINLSNLYAQGGTFFEAGYEYKIQLALQNSCVGWEEVQKTFTVTQGVDLHASFFLRNQSSTQPTTNFRKSCDDVLLDASASQNYTRYWMAVQKKLPQANSWSWVNNQSWQSGPIPNPLNLSSLGLLGSGLQDGYDYKVTLALDNQTSQASTCHGWIPRTYEFHVDLCAHKVAEDPTTIQSPKRETSIYPNPSTDQIFITSEKDINYVEILDATGKILHSGTEMLIDISSFPSSIYFVKIVYKDQSIDTEKLIKK